MNRQEVLTKAIEKAVDGGWDGGNALPFTRFHIYEGLAVDFFPSGPRKQLEQIIFSHEFARALWGVAPTDPIYGHNLLLLRLTFTQYAVMHQDKTYAVDDRALTVAFQEFQRGKGWEGTGSIDKDEARRVEYELEKKMFQIPFKTHKLSSVDIDGSIPAWQYHLQRMVITEDPIDYLNDHI